MVFESRLEREENADMTSSQTKVRGKQAEMLTRLLRQSRTTSFCSDKEVQNNLVKEAENIIEFLKHRMYLQITKWNIQEGEEEEVGSEKQMC